MESFYVIGILFVAAGGIYAAYWSFAIRRRMRVPSYRRQSLIVGTISIYGAVAVILFYAVYFFSSDLPPTFKQVLVPTQEFLYAIVPAIMMAWADSSIHVARRLDPLLRDSFRWSRTRLVLWPMLALSNFALIVGSRLTTNYDLSAWAGLVSGLILLGVSVLAVFQASTRAADRNFRRSMEWFVTGLGFLLVYNAGFISLLFVFSVNNVFAYTPLNFIWAVIANFAIGPLQFYSLYRCSRSLVSLNKISLVEPT